MALRCRPAAGIRALPPAAQAAAVAEPAPPLAAQVARASVLPADAVRSLPGCARDRHASRSPARPGIRYQRTGHLLLDAERPALRRAGVRGAPDSRGYGGAPGLDDRLDRVGPHPVCAARAFTLRRPDALATRGARAAVRGHGRDSERRGARRRGALPRAEAAAQVRRAPIRGRSRRPGASPVRGLPVEIRRAERGVSVWIWVSRDAPSSSRSGAAVSVTAS